MESTATRTARPIWTFSSRPWARSRQIDLGDTASIRAASATRTTRAPHCLSEPSLVLRCIVILQRAYAGPLLLENESGYEKPRLSVSLTEGYSLPDTR